MAKNHTYEKITCNGMALHILGTAASNITLKNLQCKKTLKQSGEYGCNGGFFNFADASQNPRRVISLAKVDGHVVGPNDNDGNINNNGAGVILWNGSQLVCLTNHLEAHVDDIPDTDEEGTWAQGGISFWLGYSDFRNATIKEMGYTPAQINGNSTGRTAMVADLNTNTIYLIVTRASCSYGSFRTAIQQKFGIKDGSSVNERYKGIMLDGSASSQMKANNSSGKDVEITATRALAEIIVLRDSK